MAAAQLAAVQAAAAACCLASRREHILSLPLLILRRGDHGAQRQSNYSIKIGRVMMSIRRVLTSEEAADAQLRPSCTFVTVADHRLLLLMCASEGHRETLG
mmetsp:Transcript_2192/g.5416  ORF Transcript_2192/g.5416 Transcript_2192/m.5416 type:complete len:101 (+) Transcript_2192:227-529(+)